MVFLRALVWFQDGTAPDLPRTIGACSSELCTTWT
jgi:hypothetical protein